MPDQDGHVPEVYAFEDWTQEDALRFKLFSSHCPMCKYKYLFAQTQHLLQVMTSMDNEDPTKKLLLEQAQDKQTELLNLGLYIATEVDKSNVLVSAAPHN